MSVFKITFGLVGARIVLVFFARVLYLLMSIANLLHNVDNLRVKCGYGPFLKGTDTTKSALPEHN